MDLGRIGVPFFDLGQSCTGFQSQPGLIAEKIWKVLLELLYFL